MDKRVFFLIFTILVLGGVLFLINVLSDNCEDFNIKMVPENPYVGDLVTFTSDADDPNEMQWSFSDKVTNKGAEVKRRFEEATSYDVTAVVSEGCNSAPFSFAVLAKREMKTVALKTDLPTNIFVGDQVTFKDNTPEATAWNWNVLGEEKSGQNNIFKTTFNKPGEYKISLAVKGEFINGADTFNVKVAKKMTKAPEKRIVEKKPPRPAPVYVEPAAPEPKKPAVNYLSDAEFTSEFKRIANLLNEEGNNSSIDWKNVIVKQTGKKGTLVILMKQKGRDPKEISLEAFKKMQIAASDPLNVVSVKVDSRASDKSIKKITIVVD